MRHFKTGFGTHFATALPVDPHSQWVELAEGEDGKCDWCRAFDEARDLKSVMSFVYGEDNPYRKVSGETR